MVYHGQGREGNPGSLADSDIVLSTYHTISHEAKDPTSPMWKIKWFRIILDEGAFSPFPSTSLTDHFV
jgi:SWI/SNF-related matrix-associated actin-dependent regulator of chromatin subfamily A3